MYASQARHSLIASYMPTAEYCFSKKYDLHIIDRVGGGDSFGRIQR